ncbi:MAG: OadG family protein [Clostridiaceae bacterium]|nr:OadG family protein [Clostridiaceae bacterium]
MKLKIKRVMLALCMVTCLFLSACSTAETDESNAVDPALATTLDQISRDTLSQFATMTDEQYAMTLSQAEKSGYTAMASGLTSWNSIKDDLGAFVSVDSTEIRKTDDGYAIDVNATFEKREVVVGIGINEEVSEYTSMSFSPVYTTGENMVKAGMNTLMGMGTVFIVLIFISLLIGCFKFINAFEQKMKQNAQKESAAVPAPIPVQADPVEEEELVDDLELVAVITAAIAASANTSADGLVVRSIRRAPSAKWKKA